MLPRLSRALTSAPFGQQQRSHVPVAEVGRPTKRRAAFGILHVDTNALRQQQLGHALVAPDGGGVGGATILAVFRPDVGSLGDQKVGDGLLPGIRSYDQRRGALVISLVNLGAFGDQSLDLVNASTFSRIVNPSRPPEGGQADRQKNSNPTRNKRSPRFL